MECCKECKNIKPEERDCYKNKLNCVDYVIHHRPELLKEEV